MEDGFRQPSSRSINADQGSDQADWFYKAINAGNLEQIRSQFASLGMEERAVLLSSKNEGNGELPLHCATRLGHIDILKLLISEDLQHLIHQKSAAKGRSCLHVAARCGHLHIVQWLVSSCKVDVSLEDDKKTTALHLAVSAGHKHLVPYLVHDAASILALNQKKKMPISYCKDEAMFEALISASFKAAAGPSTVQAALQGADAKNRTILHYAAEFAMKEKCSGTILKLITDNQEYMLWEDSEQDTFLHVAAKCGNIQVLKALKTLGPNHLGVARLFEVGVSDPLRTSPGMYALLHNHSQFFKELITIGDVRITLSCIMKGLLAELIDNPGICDRFGLFASTLPTYLALYAKKESIFDFLLETETISLSQWDEDYKRTCLHWAIVDDRVDIVEKLCCNVQLQPGIEDRDGKTALHHAFDTKNHMVMGILRSNANLKEHQENLFRDREVYVQSLNAILVGAALIASVTFAGWLQLPSNEDFDSVYMKTFWASNSISFFTAVATMLVTTFALLPAPDKYLGRIVNQMRIALVLDALLLAFSLGAVTVAFAAAGMAASQQSHNVLIMRITTLMGGLLCFISWIAFVVQLYRCTLFPKSVLFVLLLPALPPFASSLWPDSICRMRAHIGASSRLGYPVKQKQEIMKSMNRNLVEHHPASRQMALHASQEPHLPDLNRYVSAMKDQLREIGIPDIDSYIDMIHKQKEDDYANRLQLYQLLE